MPATAGLDRTGAIAPLPVPAMVPPEPIINRDRRQSADEALFAEIAALVEELRPGRRETAPRMDARLDRDLGLDSLARIELLARLERRFGVEIDENAGISAATPAELLDALRGARPRGSADTSTTLESARSEDLPLPVGSRTLTEVLVWHATRHPERVHVRFSGGEAAGFELGYGALHEAARRVAAALQADGLEAAEPVALMMPTHPDFMRAFFGVIFAGGVPVPMYPPTRMGELAEYWRRQYGILRNCDARRLVIGGALGRHRRLLGSVAGGMVRVLVVDDLVRAAPLPRPCENGTRDPVLLQYTSGSTGDPKGVVIRHENVLANLRAMGDRVAVSATDAFVSWLPLYHDMGLIGAWLGCMYHGAPLVLMPPQSFLIRPDRWLWAVHRSRATLSAAPNFGYELCLHRIDDESIDSLDLSSLRLAFCGAEPVFESTMKGFAARFAPHGLRPEALCPVYGLAENTLGLTFPSPGRGLHAVHVDRDHFLRTGEACPASGATSLSFVSCGSVLPGHELRIADDDGREAADDRQGRVQFRGPSATTGYYRNPEATHALLRDGWLDSGDLGFLHEGELYLTGRVKDLVIRAGRNLHPQGIEKAVGDLPGVRRGRVVAFGALSQDAGTERLIVVAETRLTDMAARESLLSNIQETVIALAGEPADDVVLAAPGTLLKTSSGKLRRSACRSAYERGRLGARGHGGSPAFSFLAVFVRGRMAAVRAQSRRLHAALFAGYTWCALAVLALPAAIAVAVLPSPAARWRAVRALLALLRRALRIPVTCAVAAPPPRCVFVANHASYIDALVLVLTLPRPVAFVAKSELAHRPLLGWLLHRFGAMFVARGDPAQAAKVVRDAAVGEHELLFFPEGTIRRAPGLLPFHLGAFAAAVETDLPVVPVALRGTRSMLRSGSWFPRRGALAVSIGTPIASQRGADRWSQTVQLAGAARAWLLVESGEPDTGEPAAF